MVNQINDFLNSIWLRLFSAAIVVTGVVIMWVGPAVQEGLFPVIEPGSSKLKTHVLDPDGYTSLTFTFLKNYDCHSISEDAEWFYTDSDAQIGVMPWRAASNSHSPQGVVVSPRLSVLIPPDAVNMFLRVHYDCGLPWQVYGVIGPFMLPL